MVDRKISTELKQLQKGCRGIFVGFPDDQAGWILYVKEKIAGSHLITTMDEVVFHQDFVFGLPTIHSSFKVSQPEKIIGC